MSVPTNPPAEAVPALAPASTMDWSPFRVAIPALTLGLLLLGGVFHQEVVTAVGRELLGFIWAIGVNVDAHEPSTAA